MPDSIEHIFDVEKDRRADLLQFKRGDYSVKPSGPLLDSGMEEEKAESVIRGCVGYKWEKSLEE